MRHKKFNGLFADFARELKNLDTLIGELEDIFKNLSRKPPKTVIRACASILHDYYTGVGKIFERISSEIDGGAPRGYDWHLQLLQRMLAPISGVRPQIIDAGLGEELDEYMRFRHVFRHHTDFNCAGNWSRNWRIDFKKFIDDLSGKFAPSSNGSEQPMMKANHPLNPDCLPE